jgi:hypothetical protein
LILNIGGAKMNDHLALYSLNLYRNIHWPPYDYQALIIITKNINKKPKIVVGGSEFISPIL